MYARAPSSMSMLRVIVPAMPREAVNVFLKYDVMYLAVALGP